MLLAITSQCLLVTLFGLVASKSFSSLDLDDLIMKETADEGGHLNPADFKDVGNRQSLDSGHDEDGNPDFYEGDVVHAGGKDERDAHFERLWPKVNGFVSVPFTIPSYFPQSNRNDLANVITEFEEKTCVR